MTRRLDIDALRGLMLVLMTFTHLPTRFASPFGQPLGFVSSSTQLDRPVGELGHGEEAARVHGCPRVERAVAELPRVGAGEYHERPRQQGRQRPGQTEREQDDRGRGETAELGAVGRRGQRDRGADRRCRGQRRQRGGYAREYLARRLNAPASTSAASSGSSSCHSTTVTPRRR